jgi:eukaryotic-like serine/threonine-protein kinase
MSANIPTDHGSLTRLQSATRGQYEILTELGRGGMAAVFLAMDLRLGRQVALKVMHPELSTYDGMVQRFLLEARTAARLEHASIVPVYAAQESEGLLYFAMKYVQGTSLDQVLARSGMLTIAAVRFAMMRLAEALQYAHDHGVTHRDVKPGNVMIDERGNPMLTDFGIARIANGPRLTEQGLVIGTPAYMSPEQLRGGDLGPASDQYSLGVLTYQMLTGTPPFVGTALELATAHLTAVPRPLAEVRADCPPVLARAVTRMLQKDPGARWPSLEAVLDELAGEAGAETTGARRQFAAFVNPNETPSIASTNVPTDCAAAHEPSSISAVSVAPATAARPALIRSRGRLGWSVAGFAMVLGAAAGAVVNASQSHRVRGCGTSRAGVCTHTGQTIAPVPTGDHKPAQPIRIGLAFDRDSVRLTVGDTTTLALTPAATNDTALGSAPTVASEQPSVVSVSESGLLRAVAPGGPVAITAIRRADTARVRVWVAPKAVTRVRLRRVPAQAVVGDTIRPEARAYDQSDADVPNVWIHLGVSDTSVAVIRGGSVVFKATGTVTVTATIGTVVAEARVRVTAPSIPPLDSARVIADISEIVAAIDAQDTVRLARLYPPTDADPRRQPFLRWVRELAASMPDSSRTEPRR